tara:strand:+ start:2298 stop:2705 length:408 start_codon:yes stop_codon:yes gene_type:complete
MIHIIVPGQPVGKGRPRFSRGRVYTPQKTKDYERLVSNAAYAEMRQAGIEVLDQPVTLTILAQFEIPKSWAKWRQDAALLGAFTPGKPDIDNVAKAVLDALNGIVYTDDKLVCDLVVKKRYGQPMLIASVTFDEV